MRSRPQGRDRSKIAPVPTFLYAETVKAPIAWEGLIQQMRGIGLRVTAQRLAIAEVLANAEDHPTAQEVYDRVQARFPHITMGTVYNTMNTLAENGFIQPLPFANGTRYDANPELHANLVCVQCGSIIDAYDDEGVMNRLRQKVAAENSFQVISQRLDFYGLCPRCAARPARKAKR